MVKGVRLLFIFFWSKRFFFFFLLCRQKKREAKKTKKAWIPGGSTLLATADTGHWRFFPLTPDDSLVCTASRFELHEKLAALNSGVNWAEVESSGQSCLASYRKAEPAEARSFAVENKLSRIDNFYGQTFCALRVLGWKGRNSLLQTEHTHKLQTIWRERVEPERMFLKSTAFILQNRVEKSSQKTFGRRERKQEGLLDEPFVRHIQSRPRIPTG